MKAEVALTAKAIKAELKAAFPSIKFSVTSHHYTSVHISYTNGPTEDEVETIVSKYQYGHFNGMEDIYEASNRRNDIPQSQYVFVNRDMGETLRETFVNYVSKYYNGLCEFEAQRESRMLFQGISFPELVF